MNSQLQADDGGLQWWQTQGCEQEYNEWLDKLDKETAMAKIGEMIESKYLKQSDVTDDEALVTIVKVGKANIAKEGEEPEYKWLIRFKEFAKPMVLNSTNIKRLARACNSEETDDWVNQQVVLYVDHDVEFAGNVVGGLRIRGTPQQAVGKGKPKKSDFEDLTGAGDIPF